MPWFEILTIFGRKRLRKPREMWFEIVAASDWDSNRQFPITGLARRTQFGVNAISDACNFENERNRNNLVFETTQVIFLCAKESALRRKWRKNTAGREHRRRGGPAVADQIPVCWELGLQHTYVFDRMYAPFRLVRSWTYTGLHWTCLLLKSRSVCCGQNVNCLNC